VTRTHFAFRIDMWTADGESIVEHVAGVEDYQLALATYRAAVERWPDAPLSGRVVAETLMMSVRIGGQLFALDLSAATPLPLLVMRARRAATKGSHQSPCVSP
jgi:hypothetical protein